MKKASITVFSLCLASVSVFFLWELVLKPEPPKMVFVTAKLDNGCEFHESTFALEVYETGATSVFKGGIAQITARSDQRIRLVTNPVFKNVRYDGDLEPVAPYVTLKSYCNVPERMINVFKSMNETFSTK